MKSPARAATGAARVFCSGRYGFSGAGGGFGERVAAAAIVQSLPFPQRLGEPVQDKSTR